MTPPAARPPPVSPFTMSRRALPLLKPLHVSTPDADAVAPSYVASASHFTKGGVSVSAGGVDIANHSPRLGNVDPYSLLYGQVLGRGASSYVQRAVHSPTGVVLALKVISIYDKAKRDQLIREIQTLFDVDCECLVSFNGAFHREGAITIALEYMNAGALDSLVKERGPLPERVLAGVAFQCLWALGYLKHEKRLHR